MRGVASVACQCEAISAPPIYTRIACPLYDMTGGSSERHDARSGSLDTIDGILSGCDSDTAGSAMTSGQTAPCDDEHPHPESRETTTDDDKQYSSQQGEMTRLEDLDAMDDGRTSGNDAMKLDITDDSGAVEVVAPPSLATANSTITSRGSRSGTRYRAASGAMVANLGEKRAGWPRNEEECAP